MNVTPQDLKETLFIIMNFYIIVVLYLDLYTMISYVTVSINFNKWDAIFLEIKSINLLNLPTSQLLISIENVTISPKPIRSILDAKTKQVQSATLTPTPSNKLGTSKEPINGNHVVIEFGSNTCQKMVVSIWYVI